MIVLNHHDSSNVKAPFTARLLKALKLRLIRSYSLRTEVGKLGQAPMG